MKKTIFSAIILAAASFACNAQAQQEVMLNKGDQTVETVKLGADDYIAFGRPEGGPVQKDVEVVSTEVGKNYVSYKVETKEADKIYSHMLLKKSYVELLSIQMNNYFDENDKEALNNIFRTLIYAGYGEVSMGTQAFTIKDGEKDSLGEINFIPGGQEYYLVTAGITMNGDEPSLDNDINYVMVRTKDPGVSSETLTVEYKGVNDNGNAWFDVQSGEGIGSLYFVFGTTVTRATFHSHLGEEENWDILSRTFPVKASAKASAAKGMAPMNGRVAGVAKRK